MTRTPRSYVIGDIHGHLLSLLRLLRAAELIDDTQHWCGGEASLWFVGDFVDRGPNGAEVLDLVIRLQHEARSAGGSVNSVIGNHEVLLLAANQFGDRVSPGPGGTFRQDWLVCGGCQRDLQLLRPHHVDWMLSLPAMACVNDTVLVHADSTFYEDCGENIAAVNEAVSCILASSHADSWIQLLDAFCRKLAFCDRDAHGSRRALHFLRRFNGLRLVHGHTPIYYSNGEKARHPTQALVYADNRCVNVDGGIYMGGPGFVYELQPAQN
jgi:hypothetical protein